jgi:hypothetical protein
MAHSIHRAWTKAIVVSLLVSALFTLGGSILFGGGRSYLPDVEWDRVDKMTYREAQEYLLKRSTALSGWDVLVQGVQNPQYWLHLLQAWLTMFVFALIACGVLLWRLGLARAPSNPTVETDARKSGARGSP